MCSEREGIIPALESSHAVWATVQLAKTMPKDANIVMTLSGRGDKDVEQVRVVVVCFVQPELPCPSTNLSVHAAFFTTDCRSSAEVGRQARLAPGPLRSCSLTVSAIPVLYRLLDCPTQCVFLDRVVSSTRKGFQSKSRLS